MSELPDFTNQVVFSQNCKTPMFIDITKNLDKKDFKVSLISIVPQTGTHIDAPAHFIVTGQILKSP